MKSISTILVLVFIFSCNSAEEEKPFVQQDQKFYPIEAFLKSELTTLDSSPVALFYIVNRDGRTDTSIIDKKLLHEQARELTEPDISKDPLKAKYKETVFMDETINSVTLSYVTEDPAESIRKVEVFVHPDTEKVKYVYVEKIKMSGDSSIEKKMIWTTGKYLQINSAITPKNGAAVNVFEKYVWDVLQ